MDDSDTKNGHEHHTDSSPSKAQDIVNEEVSNDDVHDNQGTLKEPKELLSKSEGDVRATNGSNRDSTPTHAHPHRGEKQIKPNKVYIGGLPEHTRQEDLQACFGKIGDIVAIELKLGYGFVEFTTRAAAEESVEKYNEGYFMGNKIRVELSHGGGRTAKYAGEPGACFKCGQQGHWARECPTAPPSDRGMSESHDRGRPFISNYPVGGAERLGAKADYPPGRYYLPPRESRYPEGYPPSRDYRDYRASRPVSPPRGYRDYSAPVRSREYEDYRMRPPSISPARYDNRATYYATPVEAGYREPPPGYIPRPSYPVSREVPYDRRPPPDRYMYGPPSTGARPRSPPGPPSRMARDEYERVTPPLREYPPAIGEFRGRMTPPRYTEDRSRYRRRSQSPVSSRTAAPSYVEPPLGYPVSSASYSGSGSGQRSSRDEYRPERNTRA